MLSEVQRLIDSVSLKEDVIREENKDICKDICKDIFKDVYRCDLDKPCVQYCVSDPSHCGVLVKSKLDSF